MGNGDIPRVWYHYASQVRDLKVLFEWFRYERFYYQSQCRQRR